MTRTDRIRGAIWAVALAALAGAAVGCQTANPAPSNSPSGSATTAPVPPSATLASGVSGPWAGLALWPLPAGPAPSASLAVWHDGFVAIDESGPSPAAWYSPDGRDWTRSMSADAVFAAAAVEWLVAAPGGFVAVGMQAGPTPETSPTAFPAAGQPRWCGAGRLISRPCAVWFSPDGRSWRQVETAALLSGFAIEDVAAGPHGVVAIGFGTESIPGPAQIWFSAAGSNWRSIELPAAMRYAGLNFVAAGPNGFEAVGEPVLTDIGNQIRPGAWSSTDGIAWTPSELPYDQRRDSGNSLDKVFIGRDGMVALASPGYLASGPAEFQSSDGRSWQWRQPTDVTPLISDGTRMVGRTAGGASAGELEQSYDGIDWTPLPIAAGGPLPPTCAVLAIAATGVLVAGDSCPVRFLAGLA
jgi:hypothetical protein